MRRLLSHRPACRMIVTIRAIHPTSPLLPLWRGNGIGFSDNGADDVFGGGDPQLLEELWSEYELAVSLVESRHVRSSGDLDSIDNKELQPSINEYDVRRMHRERREIDQLKAALQQHIEQQRNAEVDGATTTSIEREKKGITDFQNQCQMCIDDVSDTIERQLRAEMSAEHSQKQADLNGLEVEEEMVERSTGSYAADPSEQHRPIIDNSDFEISRLRGRIDDLEVENDALKELCRELQSEVAALKNRAR